MRFWRINENDERDGKRAPWWTHFRLFVYPFHPRDMMRRRDQDEVWDRLGWKAEAIVGLEWVCKWKRRTPFAAGFSVELGGMGHEAMISADFGPVAVYLWCEGLFRRALRRFQAYEADREISLQYHHGTFYWRLWVTDTGWRRETPRWRHGSWCPADALLGRPAYSSEIVERVEAEVSLPEGRYPVRLDFSMDRWKRPRWPWDQRVSRCHAEMLKPVPVPGKGENPWDCSDDAIFSSTFPCGRSVPEAIGRLTQSVLSDRERHGTVDWTPA